MKAPRFLIALLAVTVTAALPVAEAAAQGRGRGRDRDEGRGRAEQVQPRSQGHGRAGYGPPGQQRRQYDRGGYLPPQSGARIEDPSRFRLREPPRGYDWVRMGDRYMMVDQRTGQIFDVVR